MGDEAKPTPLHALHLELGGRLVEFAGYELPVRYETGLAEEHLHTRRAASLFDVSHMGVIEVTGDDADRQLERVLPQDLIALQPGRQRYGFLTNEEGGVIDDLTVGNDETHFTLVVNADRKHHDLAHLQDHLDCDVRLRDDLAILALQGPQAVAALARLSEVVTSMKFMDHLRTTVGSATWRVSRSGYTGEDGFEIVLPAEDAEGPARELLAMPEVAPAGLGARDSLRLEAGLCLYGQDLDETTTPIEADLAWAIQRRRKAEGGFLGADTVLQQLAEGPPRRRVGLRPDGRAPVRRGARLLHGQEAAGEVTSGTVGPTVGGPLAMGYVTSSLGEPGRELTAAERGRRITCHVADLPFVPHRYRRGERGGSS